MLQFASGCILLLFFALVACRMAVTHRTIGFMLALLTCITVMLMVMPMGVVPFLIFLVITLLPATAWVNNHPKRS